MASKQISIREDIYDRLKSQKEENESFSDVIKRLLNNQSNFEKVKQCFGLSKSLPEEFVDEFRKASKETREMIKNRIQAQ
jgi:predicted CopG family antitoxin